MKIIVPVSGGKDSQACVKLAVQNHGAENVTGLFCDTQFEHPITYAHVDKIGQMYGIHIDRICAGSVVQQCERFGRFPGGGARHCTDYLKIRPTKQYLAALNNVEVWYGMRTGESAARNTKYGERISTDLHPLHEIMPSKYPKYLAKQGIMFRLPILEWSDQDVLGFLGDEANPLYAQGFDRVGCFPCLASGDKWKEKAFGHDEFGRQQKVIVMELSKKIGKSIWTSKSGAQRNNEAQGCLVCSI